MKQSIKLILGGALLLALPLFLTSCDEILGEWSKPAPAVVTPEPETPVKLTSITLNKPSTTLNVGTTETLKVDAFAPDDATDKSVTWSSDKDAVATVDENGLVTAVAVGTAVITATAKDGSGVTDKCTVTVSVPGLLTGEFSVADGKKVRFAQGNLQAKTEDLGVSWTWTLATNQWDYVGNAAANNKISGNGEVSANGAVDLFGWIGESNTAWEGDLGTKLNAAMYGITNSVAADNYGSSDNQNLKSDWGNTIGTGWRTLSKDEWTYLFNTRTTGGTVLGTSSASYAHATINTDNGTGGVNGIILFPDGVDIAVSEVTTAGTVNGTSDWGTKCTIDQWTNLAAKGCVFLPAAGQRKYNYSPGNITLENVNERAYYWTSTSHDSSGAQFIEIKSGTLNPGSWNSRINGYAVRLVYPAQ